MNGFYDFLLFLIIFGAIAGFFSAVGVFDKMAVPSTGLTVSQSTVTEFQSGAESQNSTDFSVWDIISMGLKGLFTWIKVVFLLGVMVYDIAVQMGCPTAIAAAIGALIQLPTNFITFVGLYEWWTGRSLT